MFFRVHRVAGALALAMLTAACSDGPISPSAAPEPNEAAGELAAAAGRPRLIPAQVKYSDRGARPATGRAGSATLTARALQGKDGTTELEVAAGSSRTASPVLEHLQVKQINGGGELVRTLNYRPSPGAAAAFTYAGLALGGTLRVQGNVSDGHRTGVVTVTETIHLRPDLRASLQAPAAALVGAPVNIAATVTEANGDVGARADCVLMVNDVQADRADGIWVDAGDAVSCAFTYVPSAPGTARLQVLVLDVTPADYDGANNTAEGTMQVTGPEPEPSSFSYYAEAQDAVTTGRLTSRSTSHYLEQNLVLNDSSTQDRTDRFTATTFNGWMSRSVALPLTRVELRQESDGALLHSADYADMSGNEYPHTDFPGCTSRWNGDGALFYLCTAGGEFPYTGFQYQLYGTVVIYSGVAHTSGWYTDTNETYYLYSEYGPHEYANGVPGLAIGSAVDFSIRITSGGETFQAAPTVVLRPAQTQTWTMFEPTGTFCDSGYYGPALSYDICYTHAGTVTRRHGFVGYYVE